MVCCASVITNNSSDSLSSGHQCAQCSHYDTQVHLWMRCCYMPQSRCFTCNIPHLSVINLWMSEDPSARITLNWSASFCVWEVCNWFCAALYLRLSQKAVDRRKGKVIRLNGYCWISVCYPTEEQCLVCINQEETHWLVILRCHSFCKHADPCGRYRDPSSTVLKNQCLFTRVTQVHLCVPMFDELMYVYYINKTLK